MTATLRADHGRALGRPSPNSNRQRRPVTPELTPRRGLGMIRGVLGASRSFGGGVDGGGRED